MMAGRMVVGVVVTALAVVSVAAAAEPLPSDPRIQTGALANGVNWMYRQHDNPPGKMALMVNIRSGSLNETDAQRGLAHFIEHMCFNGTEHYAPGELIKYFESIGMEFGADLNAFTSFDQTAYMLFLPDTEEATIDKALMTLSDYVFRALLSAEEIEKERGVVMEEWRSRRGAFARVLDKQLELVFEGTRFAQRLPIGEPEVFNHAAREQFVDYYHTWYRPELVTIMLVGDAPLERSRASIKKWFGQGQARSPARDDKGPEFKPFSKLRAFVITDPELAACDVSMTNIEAARPAVTTVERFRTDLLEYVASWIVDRRLDQRVQKGEAAYRSAHTYVADFFRGGVQVYGSARGEPGDWAKMLEELIIEVSRAREHGFTARELELARKEFIADARRAVETEPTRNARSFLFEMNEAVADGEPILSAEQERALIERLLPAVSLSEVNASFAGHYSAKAFAYVVTMPEKEDVKVPSSEEVLAAARAALARKTEAPSEAEAPTTLLAQEPTPGQTVETATDEELKVTSLWLGNGVRVHHRFMDYKKDQVLVSINLAGGRIEETPDTLGLTRTAASALDDQPATSRLTSTNIKDLITGKNISVSVGARGSDTLSFMVSGSPKELETGLQLVHALLTDGRIEPSALKVWKQRQIQRNTMLQSIPEFKVWEALAEELSGNDLRWQPLLKKERVEAITLADVQAWYDRMRQKAPIEVAVVGEIERDRTRRLVEKYIGSLPERRRTAEHLDGLRKLHRATGPLVRRVAVQTMTPKAATYAGFVGCDATNVYDLRALSLASNILSSRLIERIREELALAYSPQAANVPSTAYEDAGMFFAPISCEPAKAAQVVEEVQKIFAAFADRGPTEEELANAKKQIENDLDEGMREPSYWLGVLGDLDYHHKSLEDEKAEPTAYRPYQVEDILRVFKKYHTPQRRFEVIAKPAAAAAEAEVSKEPSAAPAP